MRYYPIRTISQLPAPFKTDVLSTAESESHWLSSTALLIPDSTAQTGSCQFSVQMTGKDANVFERQFTNQLENLIRVMDESVQFLESRSVNPRAVTFSRLAIEEIGTNIIKYGYDDAAAHEILLRLQLEPGRVVILFEDDGHEYNPLLAPEPRINLPLDEREPGGLGIHLIRQLAQQMDYQRCSGRNRLTVRIPA